MKNRRGLLQLEGLTERIVPAVSIRSVDGDLVISGIANLNGGSPTLWLTVSADNTVDIRDGGSNATTGGVNRGSYEVTGDLIFNLSNRNDIVTIDFDGNFVLDGNITANLNNGNDTINFTNLGELDATISGDITVDGGNGNDKFTINNIADAADTIYSVGGAVSFNGGAGADTFEANKVSTTSATKSATLTIGNGLTLTRVNTVSVGTATAAAAPGTAPVIIDGNLTFNASVDKLVANTVTLGSANADAVTLAGALTLIGGQGADTVAWSNLNVVDVIPAEDTVIEISVNLGLGINSLTLTDTQIGINGTDADFAYTGTNGADSVTLIGTGNTISGSVNVALGRGTNLYTDNGSAYDSNVTITGGDNTDTIDLNAATIGGLLTVALGKGANGLNLDTGGAVDGGLNYSGGSGVDTVTIATGDDLAGDVSISVGTNADILALTGFTSGNEKLTNLIIDLGNDNSTATGLDTVTYSLALSTDGLWTDPLFLGSLDSVSTV